MAALAEVRAVVQTPGEPPRRWFAAESLDVQFWLDDRGAPTGFQLAWRDGGMTRALTQQPGAALVVERVDEGSRHGQGMAQSAILQAFDEDYDLALLLPRFQAASAALPAALRRHVLEQLGAAAASCATSRRTARLQGAVVLVTRPLRQAQALVAALESEGATPRLLPLIAIRPVADARAATALLHAHQQAAAWLFTSVNAVKAAAMLLPPRSWQAPVFAVGQATAKALGALGHRAQRPPPQAIHSEGLLSLPALQDVAGQRLLIVTGEGGRDGLKGPLEARGASVAVATVYTRVPLPHPPETVAAILEGVSDLVVTSGESLVALDRMLPREQAASLRALPLVLPSRRVENMARLLGFSAPVVAATVSDEDFVDALALRRRA